MKKLKARSVYLPLLLLWLWVYRCDGLVDISLPQIFYPFGSDEGDNIVTPGHDCSGSINIPYEIFNYRTLYVCASGYVSFGSPIASTYGTIPRSSGPPLIAANWYYFRTYAADSYNKGRVFYRSTSSDTSLLEMVGRTVQRVFSDRGFCYYQSRWVFIATWHNVSRYTSIIARNTPNTFQLTITTNGSDHFIILNYGKLYSYSSGTSGYDSRNRESGNYFQMRSSLRLSGTNAGVAGRWAFHVNKMTIKVRLAGSGLRQEGRLEVRYNGTWGTVTDDNFSSTDAKVFCYVLGFGYNGQRLYTTKYGRGTGPIWLDNVECTGNETSITQCRHNGWGVHDDTHSEDVSISCYFVSARKYAVRLVGGPNPREGRVEIFRNSIWGTVCDDYFNSIDARVVCNMLRFGNVGRSISNTYGPGNGSIWLDDLRCLGTESDIGSCPHGGWGVHDCSHREDVSVSCSVNQPSVQPRPTVRLRLAGTGSREGRLEVRYNGVWGTICDRNFTDSSAKVACEAMGLGYVGHVLRNVHTPGTGQIWLDNVQCRGCETGLGQCPSGAWGNHSCSHGQDVSIACYERSTTESTTTTTKPTTTNSPIETTAISSELSSESPASSHTAASPTDGISDTTLIIIVVVVVGGLLIIAVVMCVIIIVVCKCFRKPQQERTGVAMIPVPATAPSNSYTNVAFDGAAAAKESPPVFAAPDTSNDDLYVNTKQLSTLRDPAAAAAVVAVGDTDDGNGIYEPTDEYETLSDDHRSDARIEPSYESLSGKKPKPPVRPRVAK